MTIEKRHQNTFEYSLAKKKQKAMWAHLKDLLAAHKLQSNQVVSKLYADQADVKFNQNVLLAKQEAKGFQSKNKHHDAFSWIGRHWKKSKTVLKQCFTPELEVISNTEIDNPEIRMKTAVKRLQKTNQNPHEMQKMSELEQIASKCQSSLFLPSISNYKENQNLAKQVRASKNFQSKQTRKNLFLDAKNRAFKRKVISSIFHTKNDANCNNNDKTNKNGYIYSQKLIFNSQLLQKQAKRFTLRSFPNQRNQVKERMVPALTIRALDFYYSQNLLPPYWSLSNK
jgi:hypothetical protein